MPQITIRPSRPGDASLVCYLHMQQYEQQYRFRGIFEHYVMKGMADFLLDSQGSRLWVAVDGDCVVGSIAVVRTGKSSAQLRWFLLRADCRGCGLGRRLMDTAMEFARQNGYIHLHLWTISTLQAAHHLYEHYGFAKTGESPNTDWTGEVLTEERWDLALV